MKKLVVAFDYDGTISANFQHYVQLAHDLNKSGHEVHVISGCNPSRIIDIIKKLDKIGFEYYHSHFRSDSFVSTPKNIGIWKQTILSEIKADLFFDNEIKNYEQEGITFDDFAIVRI